MLIDSKSVGKLLSYISEVSITIRMNSAYSSESVHNKNAPQNVMWLSDMLHNLRAIGEAFNSDDNKMICDTIDKQISYWLYHSVEIEKAKSSTLVPGSWSVEKGVEILEEIKSNLNHH